MEKYRLRSREKIKFCVHCHLNFKKQSDFDSHYCLHTKKDANDCVSKKKDAKHRHKSHIASVQEHAKSDIVKPVKTYEKKISALETVKTESEVDKETSEKKSITVEMDSTLEIKMEEIVCDVCHETFSAKKYLKEHKMACHSIKPFVCRVCLIGFTDKKDLINHSPIHTNTKEPFVCKICGRLYLKKSNLKIHLRSHTGEKLFKCDICDKSFYRNSQFVSHKVIHNSESNFTCEYCPRTFKCSSHMLCHMRWHTKSKKYSCQICSETFQELSALEMHACCHEQFFCDMCEITFINEKDFDEHILSTHTAEIGQA